MLTVSVHSKISQLCSTMQCYGGIRSFLDENYSIKYCTQLGSYSGAILSLKIETLLILQGFS